jgi:mannan endo-1,4-beta-mannosidase
MRHSIRLLALCGALLLVSVPAAHAATPKRTFGVYIDPWHVAEWTAGVGAAPQYVARFEAFSRGATIDSFLRESERQSLSRVLVTWEPWRPVPPELGVQGQFREQPGYTNGDIAAGAQDEYILAFARSLATFQGRVYLRYAHEMNGTWYPWSHDPIAYRRAWRHIVRLFRTAGASNVRFVWSPNPSLYVPLKRWQRSVRVYWPGAGYVDAVGSTMINFGRDKQYAVNRFVPRLHALRRLYGKPVMLTEVSTAHRGRLRWLTSLRRMLRGTPWIRSVAWFQHASRGQVQIKGTGRLDWDVQADPAAAAILRGIIRDGLR